MRPSLSLRRWTHTHTHTQTHIRSTPCVKVSVVRKLFGLVKAVSLARRAHWSNLRLERKWGDDTMVARSKGERRYGGGEKLKSNKKGEWVEIVQRCGNFRWWIFAKWFPPFLMCVFVWCVCSCACVCDRLILIHYQDFLVYYIQKTFFHDGFFVFNLHWLVAAKLLYNFHLLLVCQSVDH